MAEPTPAELLEAYTAADPRQVFTAAEKKRSQEFRERMAQRRSGKDVAPPPLPKLPIPPTPGRTHLIIGDSHAEPGVPNHRYDWLGRMIVDLQPDVVVDIGDWWDMPSLNRFDKPGSKSFEGRLYWADIEAGIDAQERVQSQLREYNRGRRKRYAPELHRTLGNHEDRISRVLESEPRWESMIGLHDLMSEEFGWTQHPFGHVTTIDGVAYCHYFPSGVMGRAIGGMHAAASLLRLQHHSCIAGHSHTKDYAERTDATGRRIQAMTVGCYFGHELLWAGQAVNRIYARGITILRNVRDGQFDFEWVGIDRIQAKYS